jgi:hypothetical protein
MWSCWLKLITDMSGILRLLWEERENRKGSYHLASNIARFQLKEARGGKWIGSHIVWIVWLLLSCSFAKLRVL